MKRTVSLMLVLAVVIFLSGFLKYTPFEHISLFLFLLLAICGVKLFYSANNTEISGFLKLFLVLTGISTMIFMFLIVNAIIKTIYSSVSLSDNLELLEGLFYLTSLIFLIGIIGSIICLNRKRL